MASKRVEMNDALRAVWDLVCAHMYYMGQQSHILTNAQKWEVYCLADGFGKMSPKQLIEINDGWDWSHIRDSSDDAIKAMGLRILEMTVNK